MGVTLDQLMTWGPAWLQAIGALGAIYGGFRVVRTQAKAQRRLELQRELREEVRRLQAVAQVAEIAAGTWTAGRDILRAGDPKEVHSLLAVLADLRQLLASVAVVDLPAYAIKMLHMQQSAAGQVALVAPGLRAGQPTPADVWQQTAHLAELTANDAKALQERCLLRVDQLQARVDR